MKLRNYEIVNINEVLNDLANQPLAGRFKFKLYKQIMAIKNPIEVIFKAFEGLSEEEIEELSQETQEVNLEYFTYAELEDLPLSALQLMKIEKILKEE
ncbi:hypothetical protein ACF3NG_06745 [Aerococcaceae bacterium WGS1372]